MEKFLPFLFPFAQPIKLSPAPQVNKNAAGVMNNPWRNLRSRDRIMEMVGATGFEVRSISNRRVHHANRRHKVLCLVLDLTRPGSAGQADKLLMEDR